MSLLLFFLNVRKIALRSLTPLSNHDILTLLAWVEARRCGCDPFRIVNHPRHPPQERMSMHVFYRFICRWSVNICARLRSPIIWFQIFHLLQNSKISWLFNFIILLVFLLFLLLSKRVFFFLTRFSFFVRCKFKWSRIFYIQSSRKTCFWRRNIKHVVSIINSKS